MAWLISLRGKMVLVSFSVMVAFGMLVGGWWLAFDNLKVNGPIYRDIIKSMDLQNNLDAPPIFIVGSYVVALEALSGSQTDANASKKEMEAFRTTFLERTKYWQSSNIDSGIKDMMAGKVFEHAQNFYNVAFDAFYPALVRGDHPAAESAFKEMMRNFDLHRRAIYSMSPAVNASTKKAEANAAAAEQTDKHLVTAVTGAVVVLLLLLIVIFERFLTRPIIEAGRAIDHLAAGKLDIYLPKNGRKDEIGQLNNAANAIGETVRRLVADVNDLTAAVESGMLSVRLDHGQHRGDYALLVLGVNSLIEKLAKPLTEVADVMQKVATGTLDGRMTGAYEGDLRAMKANVNRSLDALCSLLDEIGRVARRMSDGDMTASIAGSYQGEFAGIRTNLNAALGRMGSVLRGILESSQSVAAAVVQTSAAAHDVAVQSGQQLTMLTEASAATSQASVSVEEIAISAGRGSVLAQEAASQAEDGRHQLGMLMQAVERISAGNARIGQISERISRIADKTHVLSLNAGIEAARAGEQGAGFGFVAREIGKLAEEAAVAVSDISSLTGEAAQSAQGGVSAARAVQDAIERITSTSRDSETTARSIATSISLQAVAVQQLSSQISEIRSYGGANAGAAEEITATMDNLSKMIHGMNGKVAQFSLGDGAA